MTMHWTPPRPAPPPAHPEPGDWVTIVGICGCGRETGRRTILWPSEGQTVFCATSCRGSWYCSHLTPTAVLQWTRYVSAPRWERAHP